MAATMAGRKKKGPLVLDIEEQDMNTVLNSTDPRVLETMKKVEKVFKLFDQLNTKEVDIREVGTIVRALGLYPSEADIQDIISVCKTSGARVVSVLKQERLVPVLVKLLMDGSEYPPPPKDLIWAAFKYLDREKLGFIEPSRLKEVLMKQGEPFTEEEADNMLKFAVNPETVKVNWEDYLRAVNYELPDDYLKMEKELKNKLTKGKSRGQSYDK